MECCVMHVQTCQNPVTIGYNHSAAIAFDAGFIHKLPLILDLTSYLHTKRVTQDNKGTTLQ
jgi:hypothetical protein